MISKDVAGLIEKYQTSKGTFFANICFDKVYWSNGKKSVVWCNKPKEWGSIFFAVWYNEELFVNNNKILYKYDVIKNIWINAPKIKMFTLPKVFPLTVPKLPIEERYHLNWDKIGNTSEDSDRDDPDSDNYEESTFFYYNDGIYQLYENRHRIWSFDSDTNLWVLSDTHYHHSKTTIFVNYNYFIVNGNFYQFDFEELEIEELFYCEDCNFETCDCCCCKCQKVL